MAVSYKSSIRIKICVVLTSLFTDTYNQNFDLNSLKSAIEYGQNAVNLTPNGDPDRAGYLSNLSNRLSTRYEREGKLDDLTQAIERSEEAYKCLSSPPLLRLRGCQIAVDLLAQSQRWHEAQGMVE